LAQLTSDDRPRTTAEYVADALRELLVGGRLTPGSRIREVEVADQLGMSRGPVREALRALAEDGLVELAPNRGAVVTSYRAIDVLEVYALRSHLGSLAIHKVMSDRDPGLEARLERALRRVEVTVRAGDERGAADADLDLQDELIDASALPTTSRSFRRLTLRLRMIIAVLGLRFDDHLDAILDEDRRLVAAVLGDDPAEADLVWRTKLEGWLRDFTTRLPEGFDADLWVRLASGPR
jgi:DNA-binding GntR family transcriptional regulator